MSRVYYPEARVVVKAIVENFSKSQGPVDFPAIPLKAQIVRNSYKQPDSWSIELDAKDFPIPPSMIRTAQVEIYLYDKKGLTADRRLLRDTTKPAIVGLVDSADSKFTAQGRVVSLEGQDMTSLFAGHRFKGRRNFTNKRLDQALEQLKQEVDITNQIKLVTEIPFDRKALPVIGASVSRTNRKGFPVKRGENYWDVMYNLALKHGFILFVRDLELVLATPQSIIEESTKRADRLFKLTWGENIEEISLTRNLGKERVPQVEVISYDEKTRKQVIGRYPANGVKVTEGVGTKRNEVITSVLRGITDEKILKRLAETQYNLLARTEQTVDFSTRELVDESSQNLLYLKTGDAFILAFDPFNAEELRKMPEGSRVQWLKYRGFSAQAAQVFATHFERLDTFKQPFYVREATIDWDNDNGLAIDASVINFVTVDGVQESGEVKGAAELV